VASAGERAWMTGENQLPIALARRVGERWTDAYRMARRCGAPAAASMRERISSARLTSPTD
jgi:hypothetical protein